MIQLKNAEQISAMQKAGKITAEALVLAGEAVKPGITTKHLDDIIRHHIEKSGARPSFLGYGGFPASACISVNDEVIHGIPSKDVVLQDGDIVKVDVGAFIGGYHGDSARTFAVGNISDEAKRLIRVTEESFWQGLKKLEIGARLGDVGAAIEGHVKENGYSVVRKYVGHGVGRNLHESPDVPNYGTPGRGQRLCAGMTLAIEPMVCTGTSEVHELANGWTVVTNDGGLAAHYENSVALTENGIIVLTKV
ncbi:MAG: type I methionyl aminopeptidase [Clostridia bacterium]|nr:type I methionyl aminopeptidase [Clostridia bacterium]